VNMDTAASSATISGAIATRGRRRKPGASRPMASLYLRRRSCGSPSQEPHARKLGAAGYIDSQTQDPAAELQKLGGAAVILATAISGEAIGAVQGGLAIGDVDQHAGNTRLQRARVKSMNETFPLERASEAYERMMSGKARFRVVLTVGK